MTAAHGPAFGWCWSSTCLTLDDLDLAPIKVQALLEALTARRRIDLGDAEFRWDLGGHDGSLTTGGGPWDAAEDGSPPFSGMSKRQLELASFEALLQASLSPPRAPERASRAAPAAPRGRAACPPGSRSTARRRSSP